MTDSLKAKKANADSIGSVIEAVGTVPSGSEGSGPAVAPSEAEAAASERAAKAKAARDKAAQYLRDQRYDEARRALKEAEDLEAERVAAEKLADAKMEREKATALMGDGKYAEARQALERADELEAAVAGWQGGPKRFVAAIRSRLPERPKFGHKAEAPKPVEAAAAVPAAPEPVAESDRLVNLYSKIAAAVGLLPGGVLNFAAIFVVQTMLVWRIARTFGHKESKESIRGVVLSLFASIIPGGIGHGAGIAIAAIPAMIAGTIVYFVATPVLAYAMTRAVGNVFIMHFESGGTLLTFDPKKFKDYFVSEFQKAGGAFRKADEPVPAQTATA